ncbi:MAG TPA: Spy/CpxP family protein refolding chaperone [Rhodopseudomonas sp.]|uniref:Spy/CpxP family protein refolding chaperone n=1 Tax=Rhodopseudomonas sp. TaxID=1078 RepID=UPI002EDB2A7D
MKKALLAGVAALLLAGSTAVYAQHRPWFDQHHARINPEDRAAFADARIAAVKAGLKLTPDQDKLWPPVEAAVRDFAKLKFEHAEARMKSLRDDDTQQRDPVTRLRDRADAMASAAAALKKIADAADPLYKTLDEGQKRRLAVLTHDGGRFGGGRGHMRGPGRDGDHGERGFRPLDDRGPGQDDWRDDGPNRL